MQYWAAVLVVTVLATSRIWIISPIKNWI